MTAPTAAPGPHRQRHHRYRAAVLEALARLREPSSAAAVHSYLRATGSRIGQSTVYRELEALTEQGAALELQLTGTRLYTRADAGAVRIAVCDSCGRTDTGPLDAGAITLLSALWSTVDPRRPVVIHGTCRVCTRGRAG